MGGLILRRLLTAIPLVVAVLTLTFVLMELAPGDPIDRMLGDQPVPPEVRERIHRAYGLDRGPVERYFRWIGGVALRADLGWSLRALWQTSIASAVRPSSIKALA